MTNPVPPPRPELNAPASDAAALPASAAASPGASDRVRQLATQAHGAFERTLTEAEVLDRIPGRSVTLAGLGFVAAALVVSLLPGYSGVGLAWSAVMLAAGAVVALGELRAAGHAVPGVTLPKRLRHPLVAPSFAALVALHAFQLLTVGVVPLLWLGGAVLLCWDQYRKTMLAPDGFGRHFDLRQAWHGYRRNVTAGVGLCLASLFLTWGQSSGYWSGGYSYNYGYRYDSSSNGYGYGYAYDYQPMQHYWPGWEMSGRNQDFALFAVAALLGLVLLCALRRDGGEPAKAVRWTAMGLGASLGLFWMQASKDGLGSLLFLVGLGTVAFALTRLAAGHEEGRWDAAHVTAAARGRIAAWRGR